MNYYPGPDDWLLSLSVTIGVLSLCALVAVPWLTAHLKFWGKREGRKSDLTAAGLLGRWGKFPLAAAFFFGALSFHLASVRYPPEMLAAAILLAPVIAAAPLLLAAWGGLFLFSGNSSSKAGGGVSSGLAADVAAGIAALAVAAVSAGLFAAATDKSLWPQIRQNPFFIFESYPFFYGIAFAVLGSIITGGILVMLIGRQSFHWESGGSVPQGARLIRMGAFPALLATILLALLAAIWGLMEGLAPIRAVIFSGRPFLLFMGVFVVAGVVGLIELLVSILKWKGNAPRASVAVAALLISIVFCLVSILIWNAPVRARGQDAAIFKAPAAAMGMMPGPT